MPSPVGVVSAAAGDVADAVDLMSMWVSPKARGRGVGKKAIEEVTSWAARRYPGRFVRLAVKSNNEPAIRLYRRHGFVDVGPSPDALDQRQMHG